MIHKHTYILVLLMHEKSKHLHNEARIDRDQYIGRYTVTNWHYCLYSFVVLRRCLVDFPYRQAAQTVKGQAAKCFGRAPLVSMAWSKLKDTCNESGYFFLLGSSLTFSDVIRMVVARAYLTGPSNANKIHLINLPLKMDYVCHLQISLYIDLLPLKVRFIPMEANMYGE